MLKLLILFPFAICLGAVGLGFALPLLLVVPLLLVIGLALALPLLLLRIAFALLGVFGHLFAGLLGLGIVAAGLLALLLIGVAAAHLLLPLALLASFVWLLRRAARQPPTLTQQMR